MSASRRRLKSYNAKSNKTDISKMQADININAKRQMLHIKANILV
jgi:hypothetical protein